MSVSVRESVLRSDDMVRTARRLTESASVTVGRLLPTPQFDRWLAERAAVNRFEVRQVPFADMKGWQIDPRTGNIVHVSGRFFSVEGLEVRTDFGWTPRWTPPADRTLSSCSRTGRVATRTRAPS